MLTFDSMAYDKWKHSNHPKDELKSKGEDHNANIILKYKL